MPFESLKALHLFANNFLVAKIKTLFFPIIHSPDFLSIHLSWHLPFTVEQSNEQFMHLINVLFVSSMNEPRLLLSLSTHYLLTPTMQTTLVLNKKMRH